ncbi:MAG: helix-turn-helix domain-containing protein [Aggregatilineales bacterium]
MSRYSQTEKMEIIQMVEQSELSVKQTLKELDVPRSTFYDWYRRYLADGYDGLADVRPARQQFWNEIPKQVREKVVTIALEHTEKSPRQLAWHITDNEGYFISESSVYRILKGYDLITSPTFHLVTAKDEFEHKTKRVNELWQTDFIQFKVIDWGNYYLCTILDDYSRYNIQHVRGAPYHPQTQGKIERYHRSMKSIVKLDIYYSPDHLRKAIADFVCYYNTQRYHEALDNFTPADVFFGHTKQIISKRQQIKQLTLQQRRQTYLHAAKI